MLPGDPLVKLQVLLLFPAAFLLLTSLAPLLIPPLRVALLRYVWTSFLAGFGQSPASLAAGVGVLLAAMAFMAWDITQLHVGGRYPAGVFAGYGAGVGVLIAQALLTRRLEQEPDVRAVIEAA